MIGWPPTWQLVGVHVDDLGTQSQDGVAAVAVKGRLGSSAQVRIGETQTHCFDQQTETKQQNLSHVDSTTAEAVTWDLQLKNEIDRIPHFHKCLLLFI